MRNRGAGPHRPKRGMVASVVERSALTLAPLQLVLLLVAGVAAGFVNTLAGGGSVLTIPALILLGVPPSVANGTNRIAIGLQNAIASWRFHERGKLALREAMLLALPAGAGAIVGALIAVELPAKAFDIALGVVLILVMVTVLLPKRRKGVAAMRGMPVWLRIVVFFAVGVYGGFIQAGVGLLLISALSLSVGDDLVAVNAIKVFIVMVLTALALVVFILYGTVIWVAGLILAVGTMTGAWIGVRFAVRRGVGVVRWVVVAVALASSLRLFGVL